MWRHVFIVGYCYIRSDTFNTYVLYEVLEYYTLVELQKCNDRLDFLSCKKLNKHGWPFNHKLFRQMYGTTCGLFF